MNLKIFARKNGGQFAPVLGGHFNRFMQLLIKMDFYISGYLLMNNP